MALLALGGARDVAGHPLRLRTGRRGVRPAGPGAGVLRGCATPESTRRSPDTGRRQPRADPAWASSARRAAGLHCVSAVPGYGCGEEPQWRRTLTRSSDSTTTPPHTTGRRPAATYSPTH